MIECSTCGAEIKNFETRCPFCGKPTVHYHRQRRCLHCGAPAAQKTEICMMCGQPVDSLPLKASFGGSWWGVMVGVLIIIGLVMWVNSYQPLYQETVQAAPDTPLPPVIATPGVTRIPTATPTLQPTPTPLISPTPTPRTHVVERGQTLYYIARQYQVSIEDIVALNNLVDSRILRVGQVLVIPDSPVSFDSGSELPPQIVHVIQPGETLSGLSYEYDTPLDAIIAANPEVNLDLIYEGQEIIIPLAMPTATPTPTTMPTPTATATPVYVAPDLLSPADGQATTESVLFFNWTATGWLADDEFYVLRLAWADGSGSDYWTKSNSWRISREQRPTPGVVSWNVSIMRQTTVSPDNSPLGIELVPPGKQRTVEWR